MSMFHAPHANMRNVAHCSPLSSGMAAGMHSTTTVPMDHHVQAPTRCLRCVHSVPHTALTTLHRLIVARMCAARSATRFYHHVLAAGGAFPPPRRPCCLWSSSFSVTFYTAVHGHAKDRQEGPAGAQQLPLTLTLTWPQAHSGQVGQVCDPLQLWVAC